MAVSECVPDVANVAVVDAVPLAPTVEVAPTGVTVAVPIVVVPSLKVTLPVGPWALLLWVAITTDRVTCWFTGTGLALGVKVGVVVAGVTIRLSVTAEAA